jgi:hypothetical protein
MAARNESLRMLGRIDSTVVSTPPRMLAVPLQMQACEFVLLDVSRSRRRPSP